MNENKYNTIKDKIFSESKNERKLEKSYDIKDIDCFPPKITNINSNDSSSENLNKIDLNKSALNANASSFIPKSKVTAVTSSVKILIKKICNRNLKIAFTEWKYKNIFLIFIFNVLVIYSCSYFIFKPEAEMYKKMLNYGTILKSIYPEKQNFIDKIISKSSFQTFKLIFDTSIIGSEGKDFHDHCDNKGPTLTIIHVKLNDKNFYFGGYSSESWKKAGISSRLKGTSYNSNDNHCYYGNAFIFSIDKENFLIQDGNRNSICCYDDLGPHFGSGDDIYLPSKCTEEKTALIQNSKKTYGVNNNKISGGYFLDGHESPVKVESYEVYSLSFSVEN